MSIASQYIRGKLKIAVNPIGRSGIMPWVMVTEVGNAQMSTAVTIVAETPTVKTASMTTSYSITVT